MLGCLVLVLGSAASASTLVFGSRLPLCVQARIEENCQVNKSHIGWQFWKVYAPLSEAYHMSASCETLLYSVQFLMVARHW